jgi:abortive infection bacteriophage resistance protein
MRYTQKPLSVQQQIDKFRYHGLIINDEKFAAKHLSAIGYNRLRAYIYPLQFTDEKIRPLVGKNIHFQDIINLYKFDSSLRLLVFKAIEKIEVAIRTKIVYEYAMETNDSHWFMNPSLYYRREEFDKILNKITDDVRRSDEDFVLYYQQKYHDPPLPPAWMTLEILSFGAVGRLLSALHNQSKPKERVAKAFGLPNVSILANWMLAISDLRNHCAHHSRIWNRRSLVNLRLPYNTTNPFMNRETIQRIRDNKMFALLSCIKYLLDIIDHNNDFHKSLLEILPTGGRLLNLKEMGFPPDWESLPVWGN